MQNCGISLFEYTTVICDYEKSTQTLKLSNDGFPLLNSQCEGKTNEEMKAVIEVQEADVIIIILLIRSKRKT